MLPLIYFVRHGQTDWNAEFRLQGQADTDLNALGRSQAAENGRALARVIAEPQAFDFLASPMRRTRETMELLRGAMGLDPAGYETDARLVEVNFGDWQGYTYAELEERDPGAADRRALAKWQFVPPGEGAESYEMLMERIRPWFEAVSRPTVCVTHGGVLRAVFRLVGRKPGGVAAVLAIPQDRILKLESGELSWL
ncbi:MAG: histidine phosphatase family protein [Rhizobiaceae bacterium]|nr:histidine phosphatase family protein [Rhizobiaceae bacterium]